MTKSASTLALFALACGATKPAAQAPPPGPMPAASAATVLPGPDAWRNTQPPPGPRTAHEYPAVETGKLENGVSLYVVRRPAGVVSMSVVALGGAARVPAGKSGLAALTVRMMTEGTSKHGSLALAEAVESLGTSLEQSAGRDFVRLGMTTLRENLKDGLALLAEVVEQPAFAPKELERVRHEWLDSIEAERQSPARLSSIVGLRVLLGTTAGAPVSGSRHDVEALKRADLVDYYTKTFVPSNLALVVVGDVGLGDVEPIAASLFRGMRSGTPAADSPAPAALVTSGKVLVVDRPGAVQSAIFVAQPFPKRSEPGYEARELLNGLLGGVFTSRLNMNLRETHAYTYGATSLDIATRGWGAFAVMTSVRTDVTGAALKEALGELRKARDPALGKPITDGEVALSRALLEQHLGATLAHTEDVEERTEDLFVHNLPSDYFRKYPTVLEATTAAAVASEAQRLDPDHAVIVVVGDKSKIGSELDMPLETVPDGLTD